MCDCLIPYRHIWCTLGSAVGPVVHSKYKTKPTQLMLHAMMSYTWNLCSVIIQQAVAGTVAFQWDFVTCLVGAHLYQCGHLSFNLFANNAILFDDLTGSLQSSRVLLPGCQHSNAFDLAGTAVSPPLWALVGGAHLA